MAGPLAGHNYGQITNYGGRNHFGDYYSYGPSPDQRALQTLIDSLSYPGIKDRRDALSEASRGTFEWAFLEGETEFVYKRWTDDDGDVREYSNPVNMNFKAWLEGDGNGLFCFMGKPGSGKSTLMKHLDSSPEMDDSLRSWASGNTLLRARHFFWLLGPSVSKSREGLLRSLLSDIVRGLSRLEDPDTVEGLKRVCGPRWGVPSSDRSWRLEELKAILQGLASSSDTKLFLLVDALDECEPQDHLRDLADDILWISKLPNVKLCISCRPWTQFTGKFTGCPVLYLDQLTYRDMEIHLENRLKKTEGDVNLHYDFQQSTVPAQNLIQRTTRAAEGVFLWLELVTRALECELNKGSPFEKVDQVVEGFPVNLNDYFQKLIYERIPRSGKNILDTAAALELAWLIDTQLRSGKVLYTKYKSFVNFWLLLSGRLKRGFSWSCNLDLRTSETNIQRMLGETRAFLAGTCNDLLVVHEMTQYGELRPDEFRVEFFHRAAFDFLDDNRANLKIQDHTPEHFYEESFLAEVCKLRCICLLSVPGTGCQSLDQTLQLITYPDEVRDDYAFLSACDDIAAMHVQWRCSCHGLGHLTFRKTKHGYQHLMSIFPKYVWEVCNQWPHLVVARDVMPNFHNTMTHEGRDSTAGMALLKQSVRFGTNPNARAWAENRYLENDTNWEVWLEGMWQEHLHHPLDDQLKANIRDCVVLMLGSGADVSRTLYLEVHSGESKKTYQYQPLGAAIRSIFSSEDQTKLEKLRLYCSQLSTRYYLRRKRKLRALRGFLSWERMLLVQASCNEISLDESELQEDLKLLRDSFLRSFMGLDNVEEERFGGAKAKCSSWPTFIVWCIVCEGICTVCESCGLDPTGFGILALSCEKWQCSSVSPTHERARIVLKSQDWPTIPEDTPYGVANALSELKSWYDRVVAEDPNILDRLDDDLDPGQMNEDFGIVTG